MLLFHILKDNFKAKVPAKDRLRRIVRYLWPYKSNPGNDRLAVGDGLRLIEPVREYDIPLDDVLEVGTGWIPTIPHMLKTCGAGHLILTDIERLSDIHTFAHARRIVESNLLQLGEASGQCEARLRKNQHSGSRISLRCPPELESIASDSIDLIYSRTVLEHIPKPVLTKLIDEWYRLLRPGGYAIHFIDNSDHFEHRDKSLSRINFLTLSDWYWRFSCLNPQNYQNRLRHSDYLRLFARYETVHVERHVDQGALDDLSRLKLNRAFIDRDPEDLATLTTILVLRKPGT